MTLPKPHIVEADVHAVRAVIEGTADGAQQRRAMQWIGEQACQMKRSAAAVDRDDRDTLVGMQHVGHLIANMLTPETLSAAQRSTSPTPPKRKSRGTD